MGIAQTQKIGKDLSLLLSNNPFVPPQGDVCFINNLPPEILSRIFEAGAADDDDDDDEDDMAEHWDNLRNYLGDADVKISRDNGADSEMKEEHKGDDEKSDEDDDSEATGSTDSESWPPPQIIVSHVCRHWRDVALSTPSLWTTIVVTPGARPPYELASTLLERSKGLPIDIYVNCEFDEHDGDTDVDDDKAPSDEDLRFLYGLIIPHIHRWRTIEVSVSEYHHMFVFLKAVSDPSVSAALQLTTLQLYHHEETGESENFGYPNMKQHFSPFGGCAPCLKSVVLWGVHVDWNQPWISSASKLVELELAFHAEDVRPSWTQLATILRSASSLEKLCLRMSGPSGSPPEWFIIPTPASSPDLNSPIQLLKVTDFILAFHSPSRAIGLVHKFVFPALKNLALDFDEGDYTDLVDVLAGPATSLSPPSAQEQPNSLLSNLDSLKIAGLPSRIECVEKLYGELQKLTSLNISLHYLDEEFLDLLCRPCALAGCSSVWLPRLTTLFVAGTSGVALRDVVKKRKKAGVPLESLYVEESCELDDEDVEWFKKNLKTFEFFEGSDDEDDELIGFEDMSDEVDEWSDMD